MTARQFAVIASRLIAVMLLWLLISNLPSVASSFALITQRNESVISGPDYTPWIFVGLSALLWSCVAAAILWFWKSADRFAGYLLTGAEAGNFTQPASEKLPWEQSALSIFGVIVLVGSIPEALRLIALWLHWGKSTRLGFQASMEAPFDSSEVVYVAARCILGFLLVVGAKSLWAFIRSATQRNESRV